MEKPRRHREFTPWDIEDMQRMSPEEKIRLSLELSAMTLRLNEAGRRSRSK